MTIHARVRRLTLTGQVEEALKRDIASGVLVPGQPLRANEIAARFGVSATPTREAMQRLTAQGLVVLDAKHTARVADVSVKDLEEVYWLRQMLEPVALRLAFERADDAWRAELKVAMDRLRTCSVGSDDAPFDPVLWSQAHWRLHQTMFTGAASPQLQRILTNLYQHSERYRMLVRGVIAPSGIGDEHDGIVSAVLAGDRDGAMRALTDHFNGTVRVLRATSLPAASSAPSAHGDGLSAP